MAGFGTVKVGDAGVSFSRGRGANKTSITISLASITKWAKANKAAMPALVRKAAGRAANVARSQLRKVMRSGGGVYGVPKFAAYEPFTVAYRTARHSALGPMGGVLASSNNIQRWLEGRKQYVGWVYRMASAAEKFQDGRGGEYAEAMFTDAKSRRTLHRMGIADIPRQYVHKRRDVMRTYERALPANLAQFRESQLNKLIAKQLAKKQGWV